MKYKTEWDLAMFYKSDKDPQIERDMVAIDEACTAFEKKYRNKDFTKTPESLLKALKNSALLEETIQSAKPIFYLHLKRSINSEDDVTGALQTKLEQRTTAAINKLEFFRLQIGKIPKDKQRSFLQDKRLAEFRFMLEEIFKTAKYNLTEQEEQLAGLLSQTSYDMWVDTGKKLLNKQTVTYKNKQIPLSEATNLIIDLPKANRQKLYSQVLEKLKSISFFAEAEMNAICNFKKVLDERRGYEKVYSQTVLRYQNDEATVENLTNIVTKYFSLSRKFYKIHAKLLGEEKITSADRSAKIGEIRKKFDLDRTIEVVKSAFTKFGPKYAAFVDAYLENGQIDVFPRKHKNGGAFCSDMGTLPVFVLLNHTNSIKSVETFGHEMGHAIHSELSKPQPARYRHYTMSAAEVASTFFEQLTLDELEHYLSKDEQIILLHTKLMGDIATIFRQVACFNFEKELHVAIRSKGQLSKEEMAQLLNKHMGAYMGDTVKLTDDDGYFFVYWWHIRNFFYVYSYAFGQLVSRALYERWKQNPEYREKVEQFLGAGGSDTPENIFKSIGIDVRDPAFFEAGLKGVEEDIKRLEKLTRK